MSCPLMPALWAVRGRHDPYRVLLTEVCRHCEGCKLGELLARVEIIVRGDDKELFVIHDRSKSKAFDIVYVEAEVAFLDFEPCRFGNGGHGCRIDPVLAENILGAGEVDDEEADMVADPGGEIALDGDEAAVRQGRKSCLLYTSPSPRDS